MNFFISKTFDQSLSQLNGQEQKQAKITAMDLQINPANPGIDFHRLERIKDKNFWAVRVSRDIRIIVHRSENSLIVCYVAHHDDAYNWAKNRKIETHPTTGAAQLVELQEVTRQVQVPEYVVAQQQTEQNEKPESRNYPLFDTADDIFLSYGVPQQWTEKLRQANEDEILEIADHLPEEAAEAVLGLATGHTPPLSEPIRADINPLEHPDAKRRFKLIASSDELQRALDYPWDQWTIFLHPVQRKIVEKDFNGPAKVGGSAGTGKTIVALHRAVELAKKDSGATVLLTTFSITLARKLRAKLKLLIDGDKQLTSQIKVRAIDEVGLEIYESTSGKAQVATPKMIRQIVHQASSKVKNHKFRDSFIYDEWTQIIDGWQVNSEQEYKNVPRLGRKIRLGEKQREIMWQLSQAIQAQLEEGGLVTWPQVFAHATRLINNKDVSLASHIVVDEAQDINVSQLRFLSALAGDKENGLFFAGDLGQRIFQAPFSWKSLGVDVRGRSSTLKINYRTSHQIRALADKLLDEVVSDVDNNSDDRSGTVSAFNGPKPEIKTFDSSDKESKYVAAWIKQRLDDGLQPHEIAIFTRSQNEFPRALGALKEAGAKGSDLSKHVQLPQGAVALGAMHDAKGLEFRAVAVMACDEDIVPLTSRIEQLTDDTDLQAVYETERHLLYVACTRARDNLLVTGTGPASEFLDDLV